MKSFLTSLCLLFSLAFLAFLSPSYAQEPAVSIDQPLPEKTVKKSTESAATAEEYVKIHFEKCLARSHGVLTEKEVNQICACSAANMSEVLSIDEMKSLDKKTKQGKTARSKFIGYAYAPCVKYLVGDMTKTDCLGGKLAKNIKVGKLAVCKCAEKTMLSLIDNLSAHFMIEAVRQNPMTLDPIDEFLSSDAFAVQRDGNIERCIFEKAYEKDNRR